MVLCQACQLVTTFTTWAVDPQAVETNTWCPALVSRTCGTTGAPLSVTLWTVLPAGRVAPTCRVQASPDDVIVVVQGLALCMAVTSMGPVPILMALPETGESVGRTLWGASSS